MRLLLAHIVSGKAWKTAIIAAVAALAAGCAGARHTEAPTLPRAVARDLAARSDGVAASLAQGDPCAAAGRAAGLQQAVHSAVQAGRVPIAFRPRLLAAVDSLAASLPACPPPSGDEGGNGHDQGKHKAKAKAKHGGGD